MTSSLRDVLPLVASGWRHVPVLVVGDVMLDQYVWGEVDRISPEAPVPVVRATVRTKNPEGAANVAMNLAGLGAAVTLVGFAGGDREQATLEALLVEQGIESRLRFPYRACQLRPSCAYSRRTSADDALDIEARTAFTDDDYRQLLSHALAHSMVVPLSSSPIMRRER